MSENETDHWFDYLSEEAIVQDAENRLDLFKQVLHSQLAAGYQATCEEFERRAKLEKNKALKALREKKERERGMDRESEP